MFKKLKGWDPDPKFLIRYHQTFMVLWVLVTPITLRFPESVMWVAFMSQYANFVGHFAGYDASRGEEEINKKNSELLGEVRELKRLLLERDAA